MTRLPRGCDYQGRYPEAAEACTEVGAEPERQPTLLQRLLRWLLNLDPR